jgi:hypothetical protein
MIKHDANGYQVSSSAKVDSAGNLLIDNHYRTRSTAPGLWLDESDGTKGAFFVLNSGLLSIQRRATNFGAYEGSPFSVDISAPDNVFVVEDGVNYGLFSLKYNNGASTAVRMDTDGEIGIGLTAPAGKLHIRSSDPAVSALIVSGTNSQTEPIQKWRNTDGTVFGDVTSDGILEFDSVTSITTDSDLTLSGNGTGDVTVDDDLVINGTFTGSMRRKTVGFSGTDTATDAEASGTNQYCTDTGSYTITEPTISAANMGMNFCFNLGEDTSGDVTLSSSSTFYLDGTSSGSSIVNSSHSALDRVCCDTIIGASGGYYYVCETKIGTWN